MITLDRFWGLVTETAGGPARVCIYEHFDDAKRFFSGAANELKIAWVPGVHRVNSRGEGEEHCCAYLWIELSRKDGKVSVRARIDTDCHPFVTEPDMLARMGEVAIALSRLLATLNTEVSQ